MSRREERDLLRALELSLKENQPKNESEDVQMVDLSPPISISKLSGSSASSKSKKQIISEKCTPASSTNVSSNSSPAGTQNGYDDKALMNSLPVISFPFLFRLSPHPITLQTVVHRFLLPLLFSMVWAKEHHRMPNCLYHLQKEGKQKIMETL